MPRPRFAPGSTTEFTVKNRSGKKPLAEYLASRLGVVEPWAVDLLERGCVALDGVIAGPDALINLSAGPHRIGIAFPETWPRHMAATPMDLRILLEDDHLVALDKPPGIVVHPARGHLDNQTLQNGMRHRYRHLLARDDTTIGPPHRLDKDTSGVVLFALRRPVYIDLVAQFSSSTPHKEYLAVLDGRADFDAVLCDKAIGVDPDHKGRGMPVPEERGGKRAKTEFLVLDRGDDWTLVKAVPHTGRPHQIRVHAMSLGLPLAGDADYNPRPARLGFARQALHAASLTFRHPADGQPATVRAPLAEDIRQGLEQLGCTRYHENTSETF